MQALQSSIKISFVFITKNNNVQQIKANLYVSTYLRVRPLGRVMWVIFPSWTHVVGRRGTSFSGARVECTCSHQEPQTSVKRHQHMGTWAISDRVFDLSGSPGQRLKTHDGRSEWRWQPIGDHTLTFNHTLKSCSPC